MSDEQYELFGELVVFLDRIHVSGDGFGPDPFDAKESFAINVPTGVFPVMVVRTGEDRHIGRAVVVFDSKGFAEAVAEELYEPLDDIDVDDVAISMTGDIGRRFMNKRNEPPQEDPAPVLDEASGANLIRIPVMEPDSVEVGWWYGGDDEREDEGIVALELLVDPDCDPVSSDSAVRNMGAAIQDFFNKEGPPSLRSNDAKESES